MNRIFKNFISLFIYLFFANLKKKKRNKKVEKKEKGTNSRITTSLQPKSKSKVASRFLKERFRSHQKSLALIGCCKIIYRAISVVIFSCVDAPVSCRDGSWSKINAKLGHLGEGGLMLQDPKQFLNRFI